MRKQRVKGAHYTIDFFGCDTEQLNSLAFWEKVLPEAAATGGLDVLYSHFHPFDPEGITGFLLLSSSHISFHTWPEYNYVACDVFSCTSGDETKRAVDHLKRAITHKRNTTHHIKRGYVIMEYFTSPVYATGDTEYIKVNRKIADIKSAFQNIVIVDAAKYGRCMAIDGLMQTSELDHHIYDNALLEPLRPEDREILILGGGDGYVAETALAQHPKLKAHIIDLDQAVVDASKKYLNQKIFSHKNVDLNIGDACTYMEILAAQGDKKFDGIAIDLTDNPIGTGEGRKQMKSFYKKILTLAYDLLEDGGWVSMQAGAAKVKGRKYVDSVKMLTPLVEDVFGNVNRKDVLIPSFSEKNAFLYAVKEAGK